jgi:UDP-N-acetylglucosamine 2-epimerase (non-hydrolysing)
MIALEPVIKEVKPSAVVVYGDVNSTLGAALCAHLSCVPVLHVEAGLRSGDLSMPEERNRRIVDGVSALALTTSEEANTNLLREGKSSDQIVFVGNPMIDSLKAAVERIASDVDANPAAGMREYAVATLHRPSNIDSPSEFQSVVGALVGLADIIDVVLPVHPRAAHALQSGGIADHPRVHLVPPQNYLNFVALLKGSRLVVTDSGGVQEESSWLGIPCLTLRPNTERPVTIHIGTNQLVKPSDLVAAALAVMEEGPCLCPPQIPLWDGQSAPRIADAIRGSLRGAIDRYGPAIRVQHQTDDD